MEKVVTLFLIFIFLFVLSLAVGYGFSTFSSYGEEVAGWLVILSSFFSLFLFFDMLLNGGDGKDGPA